MKNIKYMIAAACVVLFAACEKDWDAPSNTTSPYGNASIVEDASKLMTIDALKTKFDKAISEEGQFSYIEDDIQIKGYVTCNDRTGNMYKEVMIQDETAAITIGISYGGVFGFLPEGQEILISLKGLYIGNYRLGATIGAQYVDNSGNNCVGRMPLSTWNEHYTFTSNKKTKEQIEAMFVEFGDGYSDAAETKVNMTKIDGRDWDLKKDQAKLAIIKNVRVIAGGYYDNNKKQYNNISFKPGESTLSYKDDKGEAQSTSWYLSGDNNIQIYTSSFADFASMKVPTGKMNIKGVVKRYRQQWEFIVRDFEDIEEIQ